MWRFIFLAVLFIMSTTSSVMAQTGVYLTAFGGGTYFFDQEIEAGAAEAEIDYDAPGFVVGGLIGYSIDTNIRIEAEFSYTKSDGDVTLDVIGQEVDNANYDFSMFTATAGIFFDLWPIGPVVPYVGGGFGYARVENEVNDIDDDQGVFTAFGEGGIPFPLTPQISIVPSARFTWVGTDEDRDELFADNLYGAQARLGLKYAF